MRSDAAAPAVHHDVHPWLDLQHCLGNQAVSRLVRAENGDPDGVAVAPPVVRDVVASPGRPLDTATRAFMEPRFGHDFSGVRVHTDARAAESAGAVNARAYTLGSHVVLGAGQPPPDTPAGRLLLAHELAHVVQQRSQRAHPSANLGVGDAETAHRTAHEAGHDTAHEAAADRAADAAVRGASVPSVGPAAPTAVQRKVEMRDVGRGDQSGFARLPELVNRLNAMATGLTFSVTAGGESAHRVRDSAGKLVPAHQTVELRYTAQPGKTPSFFETQLVALIDGAPVLPLRLTNRHGLLGDPVAGFHKQVDVDAWTSGYVDIDDLLASSDLGLQSVLLHFLRERSATRNYARRIGGSTFTLTEFKRVHGLGIEAEAQLLRDFFGDPTIRIVNDSPSPTVRRVFRNSRRDLIRRRVSHGHGADRGVDASTIEVITRDGVKHTAEEYRRLLEEERTARDVERERLSGAAEHREGGRPVPAP